MLLDFKIFRASGPWTWISDGFRMIQKAPAWARLWYTALPCAAPDGGDELRCLPGKTVHGSIQRQVLLLLRPVSVRQGNFASGFRID